LKEGDVKRSIGAGLVGLTIAVSACRQKAPDATQTNTTNGPTIKVESSVVLVDGEPAGSTRVVEELGRLQKIDELFGQLKERREQFKAANPSKPFLGRATITMPADAPLLVFKSVFQTAAFAGYPNLVVDTAPDSVRVGAIIPGPPEQAVTPRAELHLYLQDDAIEIVEKRGVVVVQSNRLDAPFDAADLDQRVKRAVVDRVLRSDLRANPVVGVIVHGGNRLPFKRIAAVFRGLHWAHERLAGPGDEDGAFDVRLAINGAR
jgi:hypothetical protein